MLDTKFRTAAVLLLLAAGITVAEEPADSFRPPAGLDEGWYTRIETSMGRIVARLLPEQAPQSVAYFARMAEGTFEWFDVVSGEAKKGPYYDGMLIYKAQAGRRFETGDPLGTGKGAPPLYVPETELGGSIRFDQPGRLGMTRSPFGGISAVQFFVSVAPQPKMSYVHPCFGAIVSGREVAYAISSVKTFSNGKPMKPIFIEKVRIFKIGDPDPIPEPEPYEHKLQHIRAIEPRS